MPGLRVAYMYGRFLIGLRGYLRNTITLAQARDLVKERLTRRTESLLLMAERSVFGLRTSPYRELLRLAGCELGDFVALVNDRGVEDALLALRKSGVYFTFEEFKGRELVVRDGREIPITPGQFDNPYLSRYFGTRTSGSTGKATRVSTDLDHLAVGAEHRLLCLDAHGVVDLPYAIWRPPLPAGSGINQVLRCARWGRAPVRWFTPHVHSDFRPSMKFRLANSMTIALGRAFGSVLPWPEPATRAKVRRVLDSGASIMTDYGAAEMGRVAIGCPNRAADGDVHVLLDAMAIIGFPREIPSTDETVTAFHITALNPSTPKLLFNVEFDDCGVIEERACGCPLESLGLTQHLREIRSFGKLVGEGVTLLSSEMAHVIEEVLPSRFGGSPLDYQLEETEGEDGLTRLTLVVSPRIPLPADSEVVGALLQALSDVSLAADTASAAWKQGDSLCLRREEPHISPRGKQPLLYKRVRI